MAGIHPIQDSLVLRRDLRHGVRVDGVPIAVEVVTVLVVAHATGSDAVRVGHGEDFENVLVANAARPFVVGEQETNGSITGPGRACLPRVLAEHQPDHFLF